MSSDQKNPSKKTKTSKRTDNSADQNKKDRTSVNAITDDFLSEIRSLLFAQEETSKVLMASADKHLDAFTKFVESFPSVKNDSNRKMIPVEKVEELKRLIHDLRSSIGSLSLSHRGLFLVLISKWDAYFGSLLRWIYRVKPEIIDSSARTISFTELKQINSVDLARSMIVEDEVSVVLRDSHGDQFDYLERKLNIPLKKLDIWGKFVELTQRRNLIAHADGKVSAQYLKVCAENKIEIDAKITLGSKLEVHPKYLRESCDCLAELGFKLSQVLWRKLQPSEAVKAETHLLNTTYEMIKAGQHGLAIRILTFSLLPPMKFEEARDRYVCVVNLALAHKLAGNEDKCVEIIQTEDWSAARLDLLLAVAVLKDDFNKAVSLMKQIGTSGEVTKEDYQEWPLFKKFRTTKRFLDTYREIFKTEIEIRGVPSEVASALSLSTELDALPGKPQSKIKPKRSKVALKSTSKKKLRL